MKREEKTNLEVSKNELIQKPLVITAPDFGIAHITLVGTSPLVVNRWNEKAVRELEEKHQEGSTAGKRRKREPKVFEDLYRGALYIADDGWYGIPCGAYRNAMVSGCRLCGFKMTIGKLSLFVEADGFDSKDGTPLVRIDGEPRMLKSMTRVSNGQPDIRIRAAFDKWGCRVRIRYDREQFTPQDVGNLLLRVGMQVGLLEGRPDSTNSCGMGWGMFKLEGM